MPDHILELSERPDAALAALRRAAEDWGAELSRRGSGWWLDLPVVMGLRRGVISGPVRVEAVAEGTRIEIRPEESRLYVQGASVTVLLIAVAGAALTVLWPFFPRLMPVAPFGALLALGGWFLVLTRLRTSGPDEFLHVVEMQAQTAEGQQT